MASRVGNGPWEGSGGCHVEESGLLCSRGYLAICLREEKLLAAPSTLKGDRDLCKT